MQNDLFSRNSIAAKQSHSNFDALQMQGSKIAGRSSACFVHFWLMLNKELLRHCFTTFHVTHN